MPSIESNYDCIVMGAGPAGCTVAALVAQAGFSVLLVEREAVPRYHIGESLMPESYWVFERLGVLDKLKASPCVRKVGVQFVNYVGKESAPFFFYLHDPRESSVTWHVERDRFDKMLFENAAEKGATCRDCTRVLDVKFEGDRAVGVRLQPADGAPQDIAAKVVVDATGQQSIIGGKLGLRKMNPDLKKAAVWYHFRNAYRNDEGGGFKTVILHTRDRLSWFWYIPQSDNIVSVGVVGDRDYLFGGNKNAEEVFWQQVGLCPKLGEWLEGAEPVEEVHVAKEYSYSTKLSAGDGWTLVGDAWGFIDPLYSSGVFFALQSGSMAADCVVEGLRTGDTSGKILGAWVEEFTRQTKLIRRLVDAFYTHEFRVGKFIQEFPHHKGELTDLLIGRVFDGRPGKIFDDLDPWIEARRASASAQS